MSLHQSALALFLLTSACTEEPLTHTDAAVDPDTPVVDAADMRDGAPLPDTGMIDAESGLDGSPDAPTDGGTDTVPVDAPAMLPLPNMRDTVFELASERPELLAGSCVDEGGTNEFLFELVRRLRAVDERWGMNWKRGRVGDLSQDVVDYHFGEGTREGSTDVYIVDVIADHCGTMTRPGWIDQTESTAAAGAIGRWTLTPLR